MCLLGMLHLDAPSQPTPVRVPDMFVHPHHNKGNIWRESGSLQPPALYPKSMLSVLPFSNDLTGQSAGALVVRKSDVTSVPGCRLPVAKPKKPNNSEQRRSPKVFVAWSTHNLLPPTSSPSAPRLAAPRLSISHESSSDTRLLDEVGHSCRDNAGSRPMNGPERPIMTGTTNGGGIGSEGRAWLNDVTALVSATAANNNNNPGSNPHHSASLNSPRLHEPPPLLRAAASSSLFRPPISLSSAQDYSPSSSAHLYQQFPALHGTPSYYPPPPTASHGQTLPPPAINPYSYYPLQFSPRGYPSPPTASIIPRPFPQLESYHSSVLAGMGSHPRSAFLPSQYSSSLNPSSSSPNETASFALIPPRTHTTYGQVQYPSAESESHSPSKEGGRHKTSSSTSSLSVASRLGSRSETMSSGKNCSPGLVVVDKRDLSPHFRESLSSLSREQMQQMSYRVPSGKEGSLKHRILTRPPDIHIEHSALSAEKSPDMCKDSSPKQLKLPAASPATTSLSMPCTPLRTTAWRSPPPPPMSAGATPLRYPAHFVKGSIIQLANGELKSVEELRTEDFVQSADMSSDLKIDSSTVVRIEENAAANTSILGFSVGEQRVQVTVEAALEHPFFVFGQGWSSCLPDRTQQRYNLQCKKLQVGDVCISLTHRDQQQQQQQQQQSTRSVASLIRPPTDACARLMVPTKANDNCTSGVVTTHSIETQTQTLSSGGAAQITSCRPNAACFFPPPASVSGSQPASLPRKRRWSAPDKVAEEFIPRTKFS